MLNEERIKLMTRMASYEENEGRKNAAVAKHFRSDYVTLEVIKAIICATVAFMIVFGAYIYYDFENFLTDIYKIDLLAFAGKVVRAYGLFLIGYCLIVYIAFSIKYGKAKKKLRKYFNNLKLLSTMYTDEESEE